MTRSRVLVGGYGAGSIGFRAIRALSGNTLYGAEFGSNMHKANNTRINVHIQVYSCKMVHNETGS
jgi:hypothetical protein